MAAALFVIDQVASADLATLIQPVAGGIVSKVLVNSPAFQQTLFALDAGQSIREHRVPSLATMQVLDGEVDFDVGGQVIPLRAGAWLLLPPHTPHGLVARGPCRLLLSLVRGG